MFSRVVSNFRKKSKSKAMKSSVSSPEIKLRPCENNWGRKFAAKFSSDEALSAVLSFADSDSEHRQSENRSLRDGNQLEFDSGANHLPHKSTTIIECHARTHEIYC
jgi:hypothetical protein